MGPADIILIVIIAGAALLALRHLHIKKRSGCTCGCADCTVNCRAKSPAKRSEQADQNK